MTTHAMHEATPSPSGFAVDHVALTVNDLEQVAAFYHTAVGLETIRQDGDTIRLGAGDTTLLELWRDRQARRRSSREAGLFHTAFLLPSRAALAHWIAYAIERRLPVAGASDHDVSEAIYLTDPEGNGVEIYADRPASTWRWQNGLVHMDTKPLDIHAVLTEAQDKTWHGAPDGTRVGHVHLQVGAIEAAEDFYIRQLGLDVTCRYPGGTFYATDGYHHHIATNIWNSRGAGRRSFPATGLAEIVLTTARPRSGTQPTDTDGGLTIDDPWGTSIRLQTRNGDIASPTQHG